MPGLKDFIKNAFSGASGGAFTGIADIIGRFVPDPTKKAEALKELEEARMKHEEEMAKIAVQAEEIASKERINEDIQISERWKADMASDSWWSKNIRPIAMAFVIGVFFLILILDSSIGEGFEVDTEYKDIIKYLLETIVIAYYGSRGVEKVAPQFKKK